MVLMIDNYDSFELIARLAGRIPIPRVCLGHRAGTAHRAGHRMLQNFTEGA